MERGCCADFSVPGNGELRRNTSHAKWRPSENEAGPRRRSVGSKIVLA